MLLWKSIRRLRFHVEVELNRWAGLFPTRDLDRPDNERSEASGLTVIHGASEAREVGNCPRLLGFSLGP